MLTPLPIGTQTTGKKSCHAYDKQRSLVQYSVVWVHIRHHHIRVDTNLISIEILSSWPCQRDVVKGRSHGTDYDTSLNNDGKPRNALCTQVCSLLTWVRYWLPFPLSFYDAANETGQDLDANHPFNMIAVSPLTLRRCGHGGKRSFTH